MTEATSKLVKKKKISLYWLVPILALIITSILIWQNTFNKGKLIELYMDDASGIEVGKTLVKLRSVNVGIVENITLSHDFKGAIAQIRMNPDTDELLNEDSLFWVVKPRIQYHSISGLDTILSGSYIQMYKGSSEEYSDEFECLKDEPLGLDESTIPIKLIGHTKKVISAGTNINYNGFNIGLVTNLHYDVDSDTVVYNALIRKKYANLVNLNSVFWIDAGIDFQISPTGGVQFSMPNLENLIAGSINVNQFNSDVGEPIKANATFGLYNNQIDAKYANIKGNPQYVLMFDSDVKNIGVGSKVRLRGIDIGQIVKMSWFENSEDIFDMSKKIPALVILDVDKQQALKAKQLFEKHLKSQDLCAYIDSQNIISQGSSIKLIIDPKYKCSSSITAYRDTPVIPVLSQLSITGQLEQFTQKLNSVDLQGISNNLNQSLTSLNQTLENVAALTDSINKKKTVDKLNKTIESYSANSDLYKSLMDMSQKLNTTLDELSPTIKKVGQKSNSLVFSSDSKDVEIKVKK